MRSIRHHRVAALLVVVAVVLSACGGPAAANDPTGVVKAAIAAAQSGGLGKLDDFACAAKKGDIAAAFGGGNMGALAAAGIKAEDLFGAMSVAFENVTATEVSKTATEAKVHLTADMKIAFDKDKFKAILKQVLAAQGQPIDDASLDATLAMMSSQMNQPQKMNQDVTVVNEGGKWLICS